MSALLCVNLLSTKKYLSLVLGGMLLLPVGIQAQERKQGYPPTAEESEWGIGVASISNQQGIQGIARDTRFIPIITYENQYIRWFGPFVDFKLPNVEISAGHTLEFSFSGGFDFSGYDEDEANETPILQGMDEREGAFAVGPKINWKSPWLDFEFSWMTDVSGDRDGNSASAKIEKNWMFDRKVLLTPYVSVNWLDDEFVDFHYGVRDHEVRSGRPGYIGESTINIEYGLRAAYIFNMQNSLSINLSITSLGSGITDSPLVDSSTENNLFLIYLYKF